MPKTTSTFFYTLLACGLGFTSYCQAIGGSNPKTFLDSLETPLQQLYNYDFRGAENSINKIRFQHPNHPAIEIFDCLYTYWINFPISEHPSEAGKYSKLLETSLTSAEVLLKKNKEDPESNFYCLFLNVLIARQKASEGKMVKAAGYALDAYKYIKKGFTLKSKLNEFFFSTGLYDYYREYLPEQNKIYKFLAWSLGFPKGNKEMGIKYLDTAASRAVIVKPEALLLASSIYLKYENLPNKALSYALILNQLYPNNTTFTINYLEALIQNNKYREAENKLKEIEAIKLKSKYIELSIVLFKGIITEKYYHNDSLAKIYYLSGIKYNPDWYMGNYVGLSYFGLGNIEKKQGNIAEANKYYKKAHEFCEYNTIKSITK